MNVVHEKVRHLRFGTGKIIKQTETLIKVRFSDKYGLKQFEYPLAFDKYLVFDNDTLQDKIQDEIQRTMEQVEAERKSMEEECQRCKEEERIKSLELKQSAKKRAASKKSASV